MVDGWMDGWMIFGGKKYRGGGVSKIGEGEKFENNKLLVHKM